MALMLAKGAMAFTRDRLARQGLRFDIIDRRRAHGLVTIVST